MRRNDDKGAGLTQLLLLFVSSSTFFKGGEAAVPLAATDGCAREIKCMVVATTAVVPITAKKQILRQSFFLDGSFSS